MESRPKTIIIDIDGTILYHFGSLSKQISNDPKILTGVKETFDEWDRKGYRIVLITGRKESMRRITEQQLHACHLFYDQLVMAVGGGVRILINDLKPDNTQETAIAVCIERNTGISELKSL